MIGKIMYKHNDCWKCNLTEKNEYMDLFVYPNPNSIYNIPLDFQGYIFYKIPKTSDINRIKNIINSYLGNVCCEHSFHHKKTTKEYVYLVYKIRYFCTDTEEAKRKSALFALYSESPKPQEFKIGDFGKITKGYETLFLRFSNPNHYQENIEFLSKIIERDKLVYVIKYPRLQDYDKDASHEFSLLTSGESPLHILYHKLIIENKDWETFVKTLDKHKTNGNKVINYFKEHKVEILDALRIAKDLLTKNPPFTS